MLLLTYPTQLANTRTQSLQNFGREVALGSVGHELVGGSSSGRSLRGAPSRRGSLPKPLAWPSMRHLCVLMLPAHAAALVQAVEDKEELLVASADAVRAFFARKLGSGEDAESWARMQSLGLPALEELQGVAEDIAASGRDEDARSAGFEWATRIGRFIA